MSFLKSIVLPVDRAGRFEVHLGRGGGPAGLADRAPAADRCVELLAAAP